MCGAPCEQWFISRVMVELLGISPGCVANFLYTPLIHNEGTKEIS